MQISQNVTPLLADANRQLILFFGLILPIPILLSFLVARFLNRKLERSIEGVRTYVKSVNSVEDLSRMDIERCPSSFTEISSVLCEFRDLVDRIKKVAVDRDMLEFEMALLEKFIITSDFIREWKSHSLQLLEDINAFVDIQFIYAIFNLDEEHYELDVFWPAQPSEAARAEVEKQVLDRVNAQQDGAVSKSVLQVFHNIANQERDMTGPLPAQCRLQSKSLQLDAPYITGTVGLGVPHVEERNPLRTLVIDSILTTLLNIIGSTKTIYKYTRDLEYYATRDSLTNLYNQRIFWELLHYEVNRAERNRYKFALLILDLDNFKNVNDTHGHVVGDAFLVEISRRIHNLLRRGDIFARYGGDEFAVVLPEADEAQAHLVATRINESIQDFSMLMADGTRVRTTVSAGYAVFPIHATDAKDLFLFADNMTYRAKAAGKNAVVVPTSEDVIKVFQETSEKTRLILKAIEDERVIPYFQPIVELGTGEVFAHEVLCRIETDQGIMAAGEFIEIAERLGVVGRLDQIVMEKAFAKVHRENYQGKLFINISPRCLMNQDFLASIVKLAERYGIDHEKTVLELTERETIKNISLFEKFSRDLRKLGFRLAIDDFGSGYSSFHYMRRLPVDFVKLEGEFVRNIVHDERDRAFVKTLTILAHELKIRVISEYVESEAVLEGVGRMDVDFAQGYHTGRPHPEFTQPSPPPSDLKAVCAN